MPLEKVCQKDTCSTPDKFPLNPVRFIGEGTGGTSGTMFKMVYESKKVATDMGKDSKINLGGHAIGKLKNHWTKFGIVHYHFRCVNEVSGNIRNSHAPKLNFPQMKIVGLNT